MKLWNVFRYETKDGQPVEATRTALMLPLPDKAGCENLAAWGNKTAAEEGAHYIFKAEPAR